MTTAADIERHILDLMRQTIAAAPSGYGTASYGSACTSRLPADALTANRIENMIETIKSRVFNQSQESDVEDMGWLPPREYAPNMRFDVLYGMAVQTSHMAETITKNRVHKHRRNQTRAYHIRIQKKWDRRFGVTRTPCAYVVNNVDAGLFRPRGKTVIVHPSLMAKLRRAGL